MAPCSPLLPIHTYVMCYILQFSQRPGVPGSVRKFRKLQHKIMHRTKTSHAVFGQSDGCCAKSFAVVYAQAAADSWVIARSDI